MTFKDIEQLWILGVIESFKLPSHFMGMRTKNKIRDVNFNNDVQFYEQKINSYINRMKRTGKIKDNK